MKKAKQLLKNEMSAFDKYFASAIKSRVSLVDIIMRYIVKSKGKQIRPMFVFLVARLGSGVAESTYRAAALVELLHTATLVHDDIVDEAMERRNFFSINAIWKNKIAVLAGDYLLTKGMLLALGNKEYQALHILSEAVRKMSEGELLQIEKSRRLNLDENIYYDIIKGKTASLLSSACAAGAATAFTNDSDIDNFRQFGELVGMAFQIKDDLFDYSDAKTGKPAGNDIKEKKLTLPIIYTLNNCDKVLRKKLIYIIKNKNTDTDSIMFLIQAVQQSGGVRYANDRMFAFRDQALSILHRYPDGVVREALEELVRFTTDREF